MAKSRPVVPRIFSYDSAALVLRLVLGLIFVFYGGQKMLGWFGGAGWSGTIARMGENNGIPAPLVAALIITEFVGGVCIVLGLLTRFWSAGLVIAMLVAAYTVYGGWIAENTFSMTGFVRTIQFQLTLIGLGLGLFLNGPGRWSVGDIEGWVLGVGRVR